MLFIKIQIILKQSIERKEGLEGVELSMLKNMPIML
jgi:hypothetical protein